MSAYDDLPLIAVRAIRDALSLIRFDLEVDPPGGMRDDQVQGSVREE